MPEHIIGLVALLAAVVQVAAMGFIGYPVARRRAGGLDRFKASGFLWWLGTLAVISIVGAVILSGSLALQFPSLHDPSLLRVVGGALGAFVIALVVELIFDRFLLGARDSEAYARATGRYEGVLPPWARRGVNQLVVLVLLAVLEEFMFRSLALGSLWHVWNLPKAVSAGLVAVAFGFSHWYFGYRQIAVKLVVGSVLVWAALTGGWLAAALAHVLLNIALILNSSRRSVGAKK